jgi:hypothetical protein
MGRRQIVSRVPFLYVLLIPVATCNGSVTLRGAHYEYCTLTGGRGHYVGRIVGLGPSLLGGETAVNATGDRQVVRRSGVRRRAA